MRKNSSGFSTIEGLVIVLIIGIISVVGLRVWLAREDDSTSSNTTSTPSTQSKTSAPVEYKRTSTVPADWKTYSNETYGLTLAYPSSWTINAQTIPKQPGENVQNDFSTSASQVFVVCYKPTADSQSCAAQVQVNNQSLEASRSDLANYFASSVYSGSEDKKPTDMPYIYDGKEAIQYSFPEIDGLSERRLLLVGTENKTYALPTITIGEPIKEGDTVLLSAEEAVALTEAVQISE